MNYAFFRNMNNRINPKLKRHLEILRLAKICDGIGLHFHKDGDAKEVEEHTAGALKYFEGGDTPENRTKLRELIKRMREE